VVSTQSTTRYIDFIFFFFFFFFISYFFKLFYMRNLLCSYGLLAHSTRFNYSIPGAGVQIAIID
jgi:hypothetical protein